MDNRFERCVKEYREEQRRNRDSFSSRLSNIDMDNRFTRLVELERNSSRDSRDIEHCRDNISECDKSIEAPIRKWSTNSQSESTTSSTTIYLSTGKKCPTSPLSTSSQSSDISKQSEKRKWNNSRLRSNTIAEFPSLEQKQKEPLKDSLTGSLTELSKGTITPIQESSEKKIKQVPIQKSVSAPTSPLIMPKRNLYPTEITDNIKDISDMTHIISIRKGRTINQIVDLNKKEEITVIEKEVELKSYGKWSEIFTGNTNDWGTMCAK